MGKQNAAGQGFPHVQPTQTNPDFTIAKQMSTIVCIGIPVPHRLERLFTINWNCCSRWLGTCKLEAVWTSSRVAPMESALETDYIQELLLGLKDSLPQALSAFAKTLDR